MAKAIKQIRKEVPNPAEEQQQAISEIMKEIADNKQAIMATLGIVKNLHEMGVLNAIQGMLENRTDIGAIAMQQVNQPAMHNTIKNGMNAFKLLGTLDPDQLNTMLSGVSQGLEKSSENIKTGESPSLWKLGKSMLDPDVRVSMATMIQLLQGMGKSFQQNQKEIH